MKKTVRDSLSDFVHPRRNPEHDQANEEVRRGLSAAQGDLLGAIKPTVSTAISGCSLFNVRSGITAEEALIHVSMLLKSAEEVSDEITEHASGIERGLIWSLVHSVEMARGVVDALLDGNRCAPLG
nr:hypothetical protein FFPRI1PSEUD_13710 [Pseudomonas sp. FFPRI_1]